MARRSKKTSVQKKEKGIKLKSKLERYCYNQLSESSMPFCYECEKFELLPATELNTPCFEQFKKRLINRPKVNNMTYTPDFVVFDRFIIETKGHLRPRDQVVWKLFKHFIKSNNLNYHIFMPRNRNQVDWVIDYIKQYEE